MVKSYLRNAYTLCITLVLSFVCSAEAQNSLFMLSDRQDYVGQGAVVQTASPNATFVMSNNYGAQGRGIQINVTDVTNGSNYWTLNFDAPGDVPLKIGEYTGAVRFPFNDQGAGLSISGQGRGCNTLTGKFKVHYVLYNLNLTPRALAVSFEQHCEGAAPALKGTIIVNYRPSPYVLQEILEARTQDLIKNKLERDAFEVQVETLTQQLNQYAQILNQVIAQLFQCIGKQLE